MSGISRYFEVHKNLIRSWTSQPLPLLRRNSSKTRATIQSSLLPLAPYLPNVLFLHLLPRFRGATQLNEKYRQRHRCFKHHQKHRQDSISAPRTATSLQRFMPHLSPFPGSLPAVYAFQQIFPPFRISFRAGSLPGLHGHSGLDASWNDGCTFYGGAFSGEEDVPASGQDDRNTRRKDSPGKPIRGS